MYKRLMILALAVAALALTACGDDGDSTTEASADAATVSGDFKAVADAPEGADSIEGTAELTVSEDGTEASFEVSGLEADTEYASHVHAGSCDQPDPGGPHFKFDLNGEDTPPNEIHLPFTSDADGNGSATATSDMQVPDPDTRSVVIHLAGESEHSGDEDAKHGDASGHGEGMDDEHGDKSEHGKEMGSEHDGGTSGHTHQPKLVCADLS